MQSAIETSTSLRQFYRACHMMAQLKGLTTQFEKENGSETEWVSRLVGGKQ